MFTFKSETVGEPIIYNIGQQFNVATNIYRAEVTEHGGEIALELDGKDEDIEAAIAWAISRGVRVEPVSDEV